MPEDHPLGDLDAIAEQRRRKQQPKPPLSRPGIPGSRVGPRATAVAVPALPTPDTPDETGSDPATPEPANDLAKYSIYIDADNDQLLEAARTAGRSGRPRVDASRSAVVRLALTKLGESMSADEIVAELRRRAQPSTAVGRKRL